MTPARAKHSPCRDRLEAGAAKKGYRMEWTEFESAGLCGLELRAYDRDGATVQYMSVSKRADRYDQGEVAEAVCEWIFRWPDVQAVGSGATQGSSART